MEYRYFLNTYTKLGDGVARLVACLPYEFLGCIRADPGSILVWAQRVVVQPGLHPTTTWHQSLLYITPVLPLMSTQHSTLNWSVSGSCAHAKITTLT
jgi:hypothetical protein